MISYNACSADPYRGGWRNYWTDPDLIDNRPPGFPNLEMGELQLHNWVEIDGEPDWREVTEHYIEPSDDDLYYHEYPEY